MKISPHTWKTCFFVVASVFLVYFPVVLSRSLQLTIINMVFVVFIFQLFYIGKQGNNHMKQRVPYEHLVRQDT